MYKRIETRWIFLEYAAQIPEAAEESDSGTEVTEEILNSENVWF